MVEQDLTTADVAAALRLNKVTVQRLLKERRINGCQIGRSWRIPKAAVEEFRASGLYAIGRPPNAVANGLEFNYDEWEEALMSEDDLVEAPSIPLEAMRRENISED